MQRRIDSDNSDYLGPTVPCPCGHQARYNGRRAKRFVTALGYLVLTRAYYYCSSCDRGFCPRDRLLGLESTSLSPGVTQMVGLVGAMVSFAEGDELLRRLAGISLRPKMVERSAERLGEEIAASERELSDPELERELAPTMYIGLDGTGVPMRSSEVANRPGKQPDGTARTREAKLCVVWSAEGRDEDGIPVRDPGSMTCSAAIECAADSKTDEFGSPFAQRVYREACRRRFDLASRRVVLGDGTAWIWNLANQLFPGAIEILDRFHAKQHLIAAAKEIWNPESPNSHRMRYKQFRNAGLCTSTGLVESACKNVIGARLKRSGMHWSLRGAGSIAALRCHKLSDRLDHFYHHRYRPTLAA